MKPAREHYDAIVDCEGDIQGTLLVKARDREVRAAALKEAHERWVCDAACCDDSHPDHAQELKRLLDVAERVECGK